MMSAAIKVRRSGDPAQIVVYHAWPDFARKCEAIADLLRARGYPAVVRTGTSMYDRVGVRDSRDLHIGFWNEYPAAFMPEKYIFFNAEHLHADYWSGDDQWFAQMREAVEVWDCSAANLPVHEARQHRARVVPFGYAPYYERRFAAYTVGHDLTPDIDVLFVGSMSERRRYTLDQMRAAGVRLLTVTPDEPRYGAQLDRTIARAKIVLSLFYYDEPRSHVADFARLDHLLSNRRFVVHEQPSKFDQDTEFARVVSTPPYADLVDCCLRFLESSAERDARAEEAYQWFRTRRAMDDFIPYATIAQALR
ncbi:MAG TPA: hypothetical protein VE869_05805 [Gemmatimonas sp.]|nr:hypothetical protein [Gemmatimonas sp.]